MIEARWQHDESGAAAIHESQRGNDPRNPGRALVLCPDVVTGDAMRLMSFSLTTEQMRRREKTVTRRLGWDSLRPGQLLCAIEKGMGLKKGETVTRIGVVRVVRVTKEPLTKLLYDDTYGRAEVVKEGFPDMTPLAFVEMFCTHNKVDPARRVNRIELEHVEP
jgi:hypothetical protein